MADDIENKSGKDGERPAGLLDKTIQDHLGQNLRSTYAGIADKPAYLGDTPLPPEFEHQLLKVGTSVQVREKGIEAVREALSLPDAVHDEGIADAAEPVDNPTPSSRK